MTTYMSEMLVYTERKRNDECTPMPVKNLWQSLKLPSRWMWKSNVWENKTLYDAWMFTEVSARDSQRYQKDWFVVATIDNDPRRTDTAKIFEIKFTGPPIR